ncbi:TPA: cellobiose phosphorylase [bacterium]|nr:cellobiose phosphorylase [bacterium]
MDIKCYFKDDKGTFIVENAQNLSYLYFPLVNEGTLKGAITPSLHGDLKVDNNHFALLPVSVEDLANNDLQRNVFFVVNNKEVYSTSGKTPLQLLNQDKVDVEGGFLYHKVKRSNQNYEIKVTSFIPNVERNIELHQVTYFNKSDKKIKIKPILSVPLYSRSADNVRDHRHVTSLLNRSVIKNNGIINTPTLSFDERGHLKNDMSYGVYFDGDIKILNYYPLMEEFIGEGGHLAYPKVLFNEGMNGYKVGERFEGYEMIGGFEFEPINLKPNEELSFVFSIIIEKGEHEVEETFNKYGKVSLFNDLFKENNKYWEDKLSVLDFKTKDKEFNLWLKWVSLQPILRRLYGNSFLPFHDYGKGGRGWRDLWQDCLSLLILDYDKVKPILYSSFAGVRSDGSNATIIGFYDNEFKADRNNIVRVWMDHGAWPLLTVKNYLDMSGDIEFLFNDQTYFKDQFCFYTKMIDTSYKAEMGNLVYDKNNNVYQGSILEHVLIQNLVPYYNVGDHNIIRLEDADWNDGLDLAKENGESVAFTALYAYNLETLSEILKYFDSKGIKKIDLLKEIQLLLVDHDFESIEVKHRILNTYFTKVSRQVSGEKITVTCLELASKLSELANSLKVNIQKEWLEDGELGWFNSYYDNDGNQVDSVKESKMTLTGQVFAIMGNIASNEQINKILNASRKYLYDASVRGYRLNSPLGENKMNLGRFMGFGYGHKENGAIFSHMQMMYAYSLIKRGFVKEGRDIIDGTFEYVKNIIKSKMYPGIPEYFDIKGRGVYTYLTGSASWVIITMINKIFGVKGYYGDLLLEPKLLKKDFENERCSLKVKISSKICNINYININDLDFGEYMIDSVIINKKKVDFKRHGEGVIINKEELRDVNDIDVYLTFKD